MTTTATLGGMGLSLDEAEQPAGALSWEDARALCAWLGDGTGEPELLRGALRIGILIRAECDARRRTMRHAWSSAFLPLVFSLAVAAQASADTVVLRDGTRVEGRVVSLDADALVMEVQLGSRAALTTIARADVASIELGEEPAASVPAPAAGGEGGASGESGGTPLGAGDAAGTGTRQRPPEEETEGPGARAGSEPPSVLAGRVLFVLDGSGSMAIGRRWVQARELLVELAGRLAPDAQFDILVFEGRPRSLWEGSWMRASERMRDRIEERLRTTGPDLTGASDIYGALAAALDRNPDRVILVSDGVVTVDRGADVARALAALRRASERGLRLDAYAVQDGRYIAPQVEDKEAARGLLEALAQAGRGGFRALPAEDPGEPAPSPFRPLEGRSDEPVRIELLDPGDGQVMVPRLLRLYPRFRVRVRDSVLLQGGRLDVREYGGMAWCDVVIRDPQTEEVFDQVLGLTFHVDGEWLVSDLYVQVTGTEDHRYRNARPDPRYRTVQARVGSPIEILYHRASERFLERRFLRDRSESGVPDAGGR